MTTILITSDISSLPVEFTIYSKSVEYRRQIGLFFLPRYTALNFACCVVVPTYRLRLTYTCLHLHHPQTYCQGA